MSSFTGRVALVTGSSRGIGRYLAEDLCETGATVVGVSRSVPEGRYTFHHVALDVSAEHAVSTAVQQIVQQYGRIDILINSAGIAAMNHALLTPGTNVDQVFRTNFNGAFFACREVARTMVRHRYCRIVSLGTVAVPLKLAGESIYAASKSALITFSQVFAREIADYGVTCNIVCPGPIETDLIKSVPKAKIEQLIQSMAIKRMGTFQDVANVVEFFCRQESDYVTGQVVCLGGVPWAG